MFWWREGEGVMYFPNLTQMEFRVPFHCARGGAILLGIIFLKKIWTHWGQGRCIKVLNVQCRLIWQPRFPLDRRRKGIHVNIATGCTYRHKSPWDDSYNLPLPFDLTPIELLQGFNTRGENSLREGVGAANPEANHVRHPIDPQVKTLP